MSEGYSLDTKLKRTYLPEDFKPETWEGLSSYFDELLDRNIETKEDLVQWFRDRSELESVIGEDFGWRYIHMTSDTESEEKKARFTDFVTNIQPKIAPVDHKLNQKALDSEFLGEVDAQGYTIMVRSLRKEFEIFREENIPLNTEIQTTSQEFGQISGAMTVVIDGQEMTLQQAADFLQSTDREKREETYRLISQRRLEDKEKLDNLFSKLIKLRDQVGKNADFENFRDYMFSAMGRFDYSPEDCFDFHASVKNQVVPMLDEISSKRKNALGVEDLRPWDKSVDPSGKPALKPFQNDKDLVEKTIACFNDLHPFLGKCLKKMEEMGHLDLGSRKGKAPGGYNYPLSETGVPFIFMNATSKLRDMVTLLHEGGHAVHSFLTANLELVNFKHTPSEVAELASMTMELITMDHWHYFFEDKEELRRARTEHLEQIIETLPWVATIDKFQHWIYENPGHSLEERRSNWLNIFEQFSDTVTEWKDLDQAKSYLWQKQLHLYEVPFYYIEYGMAQLGAIAIWKRFREDPDSALEGYLAALKLGYTASIPEIYEAAGIKFDFSNAYIRELMDFVQAELSKL